MPVVAPRFPVVGIGASAGGVEAFVQLLRALPSRTGMAFVLIQHLDPTHPSALTEVLGRATELPIAEIEDGMRVEPDHVYVIPPNVEVRIAESTLALSPRSVVPREPHLPIDAFFRTLAVDQGHDAIGVVLSGTGCDGSEGVRAIKAADGVTFAQEPRSARHSGMPEAAIRTGDVDVVRPIPELAQELVRIGYDSLARSGTEAVLARSDDDLDFKEVLVLIRRAVGVDLSAYKLPGIRRRLARRMSLSRVATLPEYVARLRFDRAELLALFEDILIHVTSFFRDGAAFAALAEKALPAILEQKRAGGTIRLWCAGCSTGEEAYTVLITVLEFLASANATDVPVQLFGTDVSERAVDRARAGWFSEGIARDVGAERLARYFTRTDGGGYAIAKSVRERCVFVRHDLARDPPFSKIDLVCCRNILIYFGPELQRRVLATFHFALTQPGFLLLGSAENVLDGAMFTKVDNAHRLFARGAGKHTLSAPPVPDATPYLLPARVSDAPSVPRDGLLRRAEGLLLERYAPPGVIIDERMQILHFLGRTGPYLEPSPGQPQHDLLKMSRKGLAPEIRIAVVQARQGTAAVRRSGVLVEHDGASHACDVVAIPITPSPSSREVLFAVLFEPVVVPAPEASRAEATPGPDRRADDRRVAMMEEELRATQDHLQSMLEEHQRTNDALMVSNEELVSGNEELQSLNEELGTTKEELQSTNEELTTLNDELATRNAELNSAHGDLVNVLACIEVPIVIVDRERHIRRFTPRARSMMKLLPSDVGRPIDDLSPVIAVADLDRKIAEVIETVTPFEEEAQRRDGRWYRLHIRPYASVDGRIDGAVLSIVDIDALKRALGDAEWARDFARTTVDGIHVPVAVLDPARRILSTNAAFREAYGVSSEETVGCGFHEVMHGAWDVPALRTALERVIATDERFAQLEIELPRLGARHVSVSGSTVVAPGGDRLVLITAEDVTGRVRGARREAEHVSEASRMKSAFLATMSHELRTPLNSIIGFAELLHDGEVGSVSTRQREFLGEILTGGRHLLRLVDDVLDITKVEAGRLDFHAAPVDLARTVAEAVGSLRTAAEARRVRVDVSVAPEVSVVELDPARLRQVIVNFLSNALKVTSEDGAVEVRVVAEGPSAFRIEVEDFGHGIAPEDLGRIFHEFARLEVGAAGSHEGTGLGLAVCKRLVEAQGGSVGVRSVVGVGSCFHAILPRRAGGDHAR